MSWHRFHAVRVRCALLVAAVLCTVAPTPALASDEETGSTVAVTESGPVRGMRTAEARQFLRIPYASAPVGELRWQPPQAPTRWIGLRDATGFGAHCPQAASPFGQASVNEDCLFLNVFAPPGRDLGVPHRAPVMVWIHGGALVVGESDDFDPTGLVAQGVVVVTINYRLGALGFLAHPALTAESPHAASGNFGLMDQQAALRWVRRNIRAFGGDPDEVTIFGESAGGLSVHSQVVSPLAAHLFDRAIVESGAYMLTQPSLATAQTAGQAFATRAGCADQSAACLRGLPVATILASQGAGTNGPTVDGLVLPASIGAALQSGDFNRVPVIEGTNHDEWRLFVAQTEVATRVPLSAAAYPQAVAATLRLPAAVAAAVVARYPLADFSSPSVALSAVGTDAIFACSGLAAAGLLARHVPTFQYEFADPNAPMRFFPPVSFPTGAYHAAEIQYLFTLRQTPVPGPGLTADQAQLSQAMTRYWTRFARTGDPNSDRTPGWPPLDDGQRFQSLAPPAPAAATGFGAEHHCDFWSALAR